MVKLTVTKHLTKYQGKVRTRAIAENTNCAKCGKDFEFNEIVVTNHKKQFYKIYHASCAIILHIITVKDLNKM